MPKQIAMLAGLTIQFGRILYQRQLMQLSHDEQVIKIGLIILGIDFFITASALNLGNKDQYYVYRHCTDGIESGFKL